MTDLPTHEPVCALISGSFDPVSLGHEDLIRRAAALFDRVYVVVFVNSEKKPLFSADDRVAMLRLACRELPNVTVEHSEGLQADYARTHGIRVIVKGIRDAVDLAYETQIGEVNRTLEPTLETVFLPSRPAHTVISSTVIREMLKYHKSIAPYVSPAVEDYIRNRI